MNMATPTVREAALSTKEVLVHGRHWQARRGTQTTVLLRVAATAAEIPHTESSHQLHSCNVSSLTVQACSTRHRAGGPIGLKERSRVTSLPSLVHGLQIEG